MNPPPQDNSVKDTPSGMARTPTLLTAGVIEMGVEGAIAGAAMVSGSWFRRTDGRIQVAGGTAAVGDPRGTAVGGVRASSACAEAGRSRGRDGSPGGSVRGDQAGPRDVAGDRDDSVPLLVDGAPLGPADHTVIPAEDVLTAAQIGGDLGERATLVQFSSAFCQPCRATRLVLADVAGIVPGVTHVEIDAEAHLDLVRSVDVTRTPTVLVLDRTGRIRRRATGVPRRQEVLTALAGIV
jgi:thiol-disulfide isomerase/thioredoxin